MSPLAVAVLYRRVGRQTPNPNELGKCAGKNPVAAPDPRRRMADLGGRAGTYGGERGSRFGRPRSRMEPVWITVTSVAADSLKGSPLGLMPARLRRDALSRGTQVAAIGNRQRRLG